MEQTQKSTSLDDYYVIQDGKKLSYGYTTGTCATAATKAAAQMLLSGNEIVKVHVETPFGIHLDLEVLEIQRSENSVSCAIQKHSGDDPDVTDKIMVYAEVSKIPTGFEIDGGIGVGRVTLLGLQQPIGNAAINNGPRKTINQAMMEVAQKNNYNGGLKTIISIPQGVETAKRTFNPRLGIVGGISVLGTSGIVVPMSEEALLKSIEVEMDMRLAQGNGYLLITPGNYGEAYLKDHFDLSNIENIKCSNYVGKTIDMAVNKGAKGILFVAHIGKFAKVAGGIMDTHSRCADCRAEIMAATTIKVGGDLETAKAILNTVTTDDSLAIMKEKGIMESSMEVIMKQIAFYTNHRCRGAVEIGAVVFSNVQGYLGETDNAKKLLEELSKI